MSKKSRPQSSTRKFFGIAAYSMVLVAALAIGSFAGWVGQSPVFRNMIGKAFKPNAPEDSFHSDTLTLLILGCDEDLSVGGKKVLKKQARSDMMLIAKLDFKNKMVTGVSIPRDTRCRLPGYHAEKINAYHNIAKKGHEAELTQEAVEYLLPGIKIDRVVTLDFDSFQDVVNFVGGVPIDVEKALNYDDNAGGLHIHLKKGYQVLNGYDSMAFVRFRHGDSDFMREKRQKQFLLAFKQEALKNWLKVPEIVNRGEKVIGGALTSDEIGSLALFSRSVPPENIQWGQVPVKDIPDSNDLALDKERLPAILAQYRLIPQPENEGHGVGSKS